MWPSCILELEIQSFRGKKGKKKILTRLDVINTSSKNRPFTV